jgi:hypothetical protein
MGMSEKRRFPAPWRVERPSEDCFCVRDANGIQLAAVYCRDDLQKFAYSHSHLSAEEARKIANGIARLPEFLMQRRGFYPREGGPRGKASRPYHVALEDGYIRAHWSAIDMLCKLNGVPFNATGETIQQDGLWCVYEFTWQMDAILFWDRFQGRWLRGNEFHYPERPRDLPQMKEPKGLPTFHPKHAR